jgi:energy-coupling factor transport system ATP-binding protein
MAEPLLEVQGLTFQYRRASKPALRDLDLTVKAGEVLLVAGPSGCGKSTLIRVINGLIPHSYRGALSGRVLIEGRDTAGMRLRELATKVGTVLQDPARQLVASTVAAELAFGPENLAWPPDEIGTRIAEVGAQSGVARLLDRTTDALSGGEMQAVAVAGSLMLRPRLLVMDEPLANLDPAAAHRLLGLVRDLARSGTAVVIVEHRIEDALDAQPDRVLYMDDGEARYLGGLEGFFDVADPDAVKLPFDVWLRRGLTSAPGEAAPSVAPPSPEAAPRLEWRSVEAGYDGEAVLHDISVSLGRNEVVAVLGPNGSGKTTLFKSAIGLVKRTAGDVLVDGASTEGRSVAELAGTFGFVFQNPSQMLFAPTVSEELLFGPRNLGRDPAGFEALAASALARVNLADEPEIMTRAPLTLSFGQQKRLSIAVALTLRPRTLVLDEPSAGQDYRNATAFMREVQRIEGMESVYLITHDVDLALVHADRVLLLRDGRVVADGAPLDVIADRQRWEGCNLRYTSLMEANARQAGQTSRFLDARALSAAMAATGGPPA